MFVDCKNETDWIKQRLSYLTASDAGNYCGINPFDKQGTLHLWEEKTGLRKRPDISSHPSVIYGKKAEPHLRDLFVLMNNEWELLRYDEFGLWVCDEHPFMAATLDGLIANTAGEIWILEIKTATVRSGEDLRNWRNGEIPGNYWVQELHQMICVPQAAGAITFAHVRTEWNPDESYLITVAHRRDEQDVQDDMPWVLSKALDMQRMITDRERPAVKITF